MTVPRSAGPLSCGNSSLTASPLTEKRIFGASPNRTESFWC